MDQDKLKRAVRLFLEAIGEDPHRPGLQDTPDRVSRMCESIFWGIGRSPEEELLILREEKHDEIVLVRNIPLYSVCEHHLLPFLGRVHIAYIPQRNRITGLSKLVRVVHVLSRRLQLQERLTAQVADAVNHGLRPRGVMVVVEAEHLCMSMRGVREPGTTTITSVVRGLFRENSTTRAEAMGLIRAAKS